MQSTFHAAELDAADKKFLHKHEEDDHGQDRHGDSGHQEVRRLANFGIEEQQAHGKCVFFLIAQHYQGPEEALVVADKGEDGQRDQSRPT